MEDSSAKATSVITLAPTTRAQKRFRRIWLRVFIVLIIVFSAFVSVWFLGVRPPLHKQSIVQLDTAWSGATSRASEYLVDISSSGQRKNLFLSEKLLRDALNTYDAYVVQNWQVTVTPAAIRLSFTTRGSMSTVTASLSVKDENQIQVTHVQVQGMLAFVVSEEEVMKNLKDDLQFFFLPDRVTRITLLEHAVNIQFA